MTDQKETSIYKGVSLIKKEKTYEISIQFNKNTSRISGIKNEKIAAVIFDLLMLDRIGESAYLNFREESTKFYSQIISGRRDELPTEDEIKNLMKQKITDSLTHGELLKKISSLDWLVNITAKSIHALMMGKGE